MRLRGGSSVLRVRLSDVCFPRIEGDETWTARAARVPHRAPQRVQRQSVITSPRRSMSSLFLLAAKSLSSETITS